MNETGILFVLTAPSGTGKSTLAGRLLENDRRLHFSVSFTTRPPRSGERDGEAYHFVDEPEFRRRIDAGEFLEWADVYGKLYGTGRQATRQALQAGNDLLLDIDVQGAAQIRAAGVDAVTIMLLPPDGATLERRLRGRASDDEAVLRRRLDEAAGEASKYGAFDYIVINQALDAAEAQLRSIITAERLRTSRRHVLASTIARELNSL